MEVYVASSWRNEKQPEVKLYKFLASLDGRPTHGDGKWSMPRGRKPGAWRVEKGPLELCKPGTLHYCEPHQLAPWIAPVLVEVEVRGETLRGDDKCGALEMRIVRRVTRWNPRTQRALAVWCAYGALLTEREHGREPKQVSWDAVAIADRMARGERVPEQLRAAADAAAYAAVYEPKLVAAPVAARVAVRVAARSAALAGARSAAYEAALAAADAAAYEAALVAAYAAASEAADAAAYAAHSAARSAARRAQSLKLLELCGEISP